MVWQVDGTDLYFQFDKDGPHIEGNGDQWCRPAPTMGVDVHEILSLPASWVIYRASDASKAASFFGRDFRTGKQYLDVSGLKDATDPVVLIKYSKDIDRDKPAEVGFIIFLPDRYF